MPELPEVETVRRSLLPHLVGQLIEKVTVYNASLRTPVDVERFVRTVTHKRIEAIRRRAKYLLIDLSDGQVMLVHLGMSGRLGVHAEDLPRKTHDHVVWQLSGGKQLRFNDARRFGLVDVFAATQEPHDVRLVHLGLEPLEPAFNATFLFEQTRGVQKPIKNFIMDGTQVVGVGNIYACESLFLAGIHPLIGAGKLSQARLNGLVDAIKKTLDEAITQGGTTLRDFLNANGDAGYFAIRLQVYGKEGEPCGRCAKGVIKRVVMAGRSTFFCPACQKR